MQLSSLSQDTLQEILKRITLEDIVNLSLVRLLSLIIGHVNVVLWVKGMQIVTFSNI